MTPSPMIEPQGRGSAESLGSLQSAYGAALNRFFQRRVPEQADADDLVQEVFLRLSNRGDLAAVSNVSGYIFQTAMNVLKDRARSRFSRQTQRHDPIDEQFADERAFSPERILLAKEALENLSAAVAALPPRAREVLLLCRWDGLSYSEVARKLGISVSAVEKHMSKSIAFLLRLEGDV